MSVMHCCNNLDVAHSTFVVSDNGFEFNVKVCYCKSCGSKKVVGTGVSDGRKQAE